VIDVIKQMLDYNK